MSQTNDRYDSLRQIDWFSLERVQSAQVMVVGAGAIGNEVLKNLALLGVGRILIVDPDTIEISNLSRSILFREGNVGRPKAVVAAEALATINPLVKVTPFVGKIQNVFGLGVWRRVDVVIGCLDNRVARYFVNQMAQAAGRPWINAGIGDLDGQIQVFRPGEACYECLFSSSAYEEIRISCGIRDQQLVSKRRVPTTPTIASLVAAIQVQEFLKLLDPTNWEGRSLAAREFRYHGSRAEAEVHDLPRREDCPAHDLIHRQCVVELLNCRVDQTSTNDILQVASEYLGEQSVLELGYELAVESRCHRCQLTARLLRPRNDLQVADLVCQQCGLHCQLITTHHLGRPTMEYTEDFLDLPLRNLGVPPLELLHILGRDGRDIYLELTGDLYQTLDQHLI